MKNKNVLITIVVLLCLFIPLTLIGIINKNNDEDGVLVDNPNHEFKKDGYLYFYNDSNELINKYKCQSEDCDYLNYTIDDDKYEINYYKEGKDIKSSLINNVFAFIKDNTNYLLNVKTLEKLDYKEVKTYNTKVNGNVFIVKNYDDLVGVMVLLNNNSIIIPFEYSFIGLKNEFTEDNLLSTEKFIVQKNNKWFLIDIKNNALSTEVDYPIIDYTDYYIFSKNKDIIKIYGYENYEFLSDLVIYDYIIEDNYVGIITEDSLYIYNNLVSDYLQKYEFNYNSDKAVLEKTDKSVVVRINGEVKDTIEFDKNI